MLLVDQFRQQYPGEYDDLTDAQILAGLRARDYADLTDDEFAQGMQAREEQLRSDLNGGFFGEAEAGYYGAKGSLNRAGQAVSQSLGADDAAQWFAQNAEQAARDAQAADPVHDRILGADSGWEAARGVRQALAGNLPQMGATLAAGAAGMAAGGPIGALIAGLAVNYPLIFGENVQEQIDQKGKIESPGAAAGYAVPGAALDSLVNLLIPGGKLGTGMVSSLLKRGAVGAGEGALIEAPTELAQQALTIHQAGGDPTAPENRMRLWEAAIAGAIVGGTAGGGLKLLERGSPKEDENGLIDPATLDAAERENALRGLAADPEVSAILKASGIDPDADENWWSDPKAQTFLDRIIERRNRQTAGQVRARNAQGLDTVGPRNTGDPTPQGADLSPEQVARLNARVSAMPDNELGRDVRGPDGGRISVLDADTMRLRAEREGVARFDPSLPPSEQPTGAIAPGAQSGVAPPVDDATVRDVAEIRRRMDALGREEQGGRRALTDQERAEYTALSDQLRQIGGPGAAQRDVSTLRQRLAGLDAARRERALTMAERREYVDLSRTIQQVPDSLEGNIGVAQGMARSNSVEKLTKSIEGLRREIAARGDKGPSPRQQRRLQELNFDLNTEVAKAQGRDPRTFTEVTPATPPPGGPAPQNYTGAQRGPVFTAEPRPEPAPEPLVQPDLLSQSAARPDAAPARAPAKPKPPTPLIEWIRKMGGIDPKDPGVADVRAILDKEAFRVLGNKANARVAKGGLPLDELRLRAVDEGYLPEGATIRDFLEAIGKDSFAQKEGAPRVVRDYDLNDAVAFDQYTREQRQIDQAMNRFGDLDLAAEYEAMKADLDAAIRAAIEAENAVDAEIDRQLREVLNESWSPRGGPVDADIPFDWVTDENGETLSPAGAADPGARGQDAVDAGAPEAAGAGEAAGSERETAGSPGEAREVKPTPRTEKTDQGDNFVLGDEIAGEVTDADRNATATRKKQADAEKEAEARKRQQKLRRGGQQGVDDVGIFAAAGNGQTDLLSGEPTPEPAGPSTQDVMAAANGDYERLNAIQQMLFGQTGLNNLTPEQRQQVLDALRGAPEPTAAPERTTLEAVAPKGRYSHIYVEHRGLRYYIESVQGGSATDAAVAAARAAYPGAAVYAVDRADGTSINGRGADLARVLGVSPEPTAAPEPAPADASTGPKITSPFKKGPNFRDDGLWLGQIDGVEVGIYRDTGQFSHPLWHIRSEDLPKIGRSKSDPGVPTNLGFTKDEAIQTLLRNWKGAPGPNDPRISYDALTAADPYTDAVYGEATADGEKARAAVEALLAKIAPGADVRTPDRLVRAGTDMDAAFGMYLDGIIHVALGGTNALRTARHEAIHYLRQAGIMNDQAWAALEKAARDGDWVGKHRIRDRYARQGLTESQMVEEAIAEEYATWAAGKRKAQNRVLVAFQALRRFFDRVRAAIREAVGRDPDFRDLFSGIETGRVGRGPARARSTGSAFADMLLRGTSRLLPAWHGSPHDFDRFSLSKIGTGEGAQAYGWGLYFATRKEIAEHYRDTLSKRDPDITRPDQKAYDDHREEWDDLTSQIRTLQDEYLRPYAEDRDLIQIKMKPLEQARDDLHAKMVQETMERLGPGRLYEVELAPEPEHLLDWDKPLSEQSEYVRVRLARWADVLDDKQARMEARAHIYTKPVADIVAGWTGQDLYDALTDYFTMEDAAWQRIGKSPLDTQSVQHAASLALLGAGIPGLRYLDGSSRGKGEGAHNYVIFDENAVEVRAKYDIAESAAPYLRAAPAASARAANDPAQNPALNPRTWQKLLFGSPKEDAIEFASNVRDAVAAVARSTSGRPWYRRIGDVATTVAYANRGVLKRAVSEMRNAGNTKAADLIQDVLDKLATDPGSGKAIGETYENAITRRVNRQSTLLTNGLGGVTALNNMDDMRAIRDALAGVKPAPAHLKDAVAATRKWLDEHVDYLRAAGVEVGYVKGGYFPRILDTENGLADRDKFLKRAAEAYRTAGLSQADADTAAADWYTSAVLGTDLGGAGVGPGMNVTKARALASPAVDRIMQDFYVTDPVEALRQYAVQVARRGEYARRFPKDGTRDFSQVFAENLERAGVPNEVIQQVLRAFESSTGRMVHHARGPLASAASWLQLVGMITLLPRALFASFAEPATMAARTGNKPLVTAVRGMKETLAEVAQLAAGNKTEARRVAEALGLVGDALTDTILHERFGGVATSALQRRIATRFFRGIGLQPWNEATKTAAITIGRGFVKSIMEDHRAGVPGAKRALAELGIPENRIAELDEWMRARGDMPSETDIANRDDATSRLYGDGLARFVKETVMEPEAIDRPLFASGPIGRMFYGLMSFLYTFGRHVMLRNMKQLVEAADPRNNLSAAERVQLVRPVVGMAVLFAAHAIVSEAREALTNTEKNEEREFSEKLELALSRSGFVGPLDPVYNAIRGLRYQRDLSNLVVGAGPGFFLQNIGDILAMTQHNSEATNTAERNAAMGAYSLIAAPAMSAALGLLPGGMGLIPQAAFTAAVMYGTSPEAKRRWADLAVGEADA